jgi:hypothetical protein
MGRRKRKSKKGGERVRRGESLGEGGGRMRRTVISRRGTERQR